MQAYNFILGVIVLLWSIPIGIILKSITKEELKSGRKYFMALWVLCIILSILIGFFIKEEILLYSLIFSFIFIGIVSFISWWK
ncbi:MAG TPA: hypothetical protein VI815_03480 [Candidatus Nanoarchaeia archaeon]|nr:hypothetical protein [Candidatus Nanoarchaeia archaeon]